MQHTTSYELASPRPPALPHSKGNGPWSSGLELCHKCQPFQKLAPLSVFRELSRTTQKQSFEIYGPKAKGTRTLCTWKHHTLAKN